MHCNKRRYLAIIVLLSGLVSAQSYAHPMVAQHGTLNFVDQGVYMVLSVPITAFEGVDTNHDDKLSMDELHHHQLAITDTVLKRVKLFENNQSRTLEGLLLTIPHTHEHSATGSEQLIVMGRYTVLDKSSSLSFNFDLFGTADSERQMKVTAKNSTVNQNHILRFNPGNTHQLVFQNRSQ